MKLLEELEVKVEVLVILRVMKKIVGERMEVLISFLSSVRVVFVSQCRSHPWCYGECRAPKATHPIYHTQQVGK